MWRRDPHRWFHAYMERHHGPITKLPTVYAGIPADTGVYYRLRPIVGHRLAWGLERLLARLTGRELCAECGDTAHYHVGPEAYCRRCAWDANGGEQPADDDDNEPPGAGADPYGRPSPRTHPEYWME